MMKRASEYGGAGWQERCASIEETSVSSFLKLCKQKGWGTRKAPATQDKMQHIDFFVNKDGKEIAVDIKGQKRYADKGFILIEILNVMGNRGWLLGKADEIAFQVPEGWLMIARNTIFRLLREKMGLQVFTKGGVKIVHNGNKVNALPCFAPQWYCRPDRPKECVTYLTVGELLGAGGVILNGLSSQMTLDL